MTTPNLGPGSPLPSMTVNEFGLATFAGMTEAEWKTIMEGPWAAKFDPIGDIFGVFKEIINAVIAAFQGVFEPLQELFAGTIHNFLEDIADLQDHVEDIPIIGDFFELVTGVPDSDDHDAASFIRDTIRMLLGGYRNVDPASIPEEDITPLELTVISSEIQDRITALEGGVTEHLIASTQTIDLSMYLEIEVMLWGSSAPGANAAGRIGGTGSIMGGYMYQIYSKQDLINFGLDPAAIKCVVGANGGKSYFGADSLSVPTVAGSLLSTTPGRAFVGRPEGFDTNLSGPGSGGGTGTGVERNDSGDVVNFGGAGSSGTESASGPGGLRGDAGVYSTTASLAVGKNGNPGAPGQLVGRTKCGGSGAGTGGGGDVWREVRSFPLSDRFYGQNGGNGATGGYPGGGSSGGGGAGIAPNGNGTPGIGGAGCDGAQILRGK